MGTAKKHSPDGDCDTFMKMFTTCIKSNFGVMVGYDDCG